MLASAQLLTPLDTDVHRPLDVSLEAPAEIFEHGRTSREHDILVQAATAVDWRPLDGLVDHEWYGGRVVRVGDLRVEEDLRAQETLVSHVAFPRCSALGFATDLPDNSFGR